jgi:hypothetical protein
MVFSELGSVPDLADQTCPMPSLDHSKSQRSKTAQTSVHELQTNRRPQLVSKTNNAAEVTDKMKAVVWHGIGDIRLDDVPEPKIKEPTDAIVLLTASAICGTDLHFIRGTMPELELGTGAIGESEPDIRAAVCQPFMFLGLQIDHGKNKQSIFDSDIAGPGSSVQVLLIKSQENWQIARETYDCLRPSPQKSRGEKIEAVAALGSAPHD